MAEWRERGYVPDSDEEEEESYPRPEQGASTFPKVEKPSENLSSRESQDDSGWPRSQREGTSSSVLAPGAGGVSTMAITPSSLKEKEPSVLLPTLNDGGVEISHDADRMDLYGPLPPSPVAEQLQATLDLGLKQVSEILGSSASRQGSIQDASQSSSPLSSLGSLANEPGQHASGEPPARSSQPHPTEPPARPSPEPSSGPFAPQRALRPRTQLQMHPYALEDARYQQEFKARGLKPVRIAASQSQHPPHLARGAGDEARSFSSSPMEEESTPLPPFHSTQDDSASDLVFMRNEDFSFPASPSKMDGDDEDLPDLAALLRNGTMDNRPLNPKIFKVVRSGRPRSDARQDPVDAFIFPENGKTTDSASTERPIFFVPPSPPHSGSSASEKANNMQNQKQQPETTPRRPPTPLLSSETQSRKRLVVELTDSSQDVSNGAAGAESTSEEEEDSQKIGRIKAMKRKMKGVLPASWLKLDLKQQTVRAEHNRDQQPVRELADGKGVAKPTSAARPLTGVAMPSSSSRRDAFHLDFSDEDISSDEVMGSDRSDYQDINTSVLDHLSTDVLEDNRIDTMQSAREPRRWPASEPQKRRQQRLSDTWPDIPGPSNRGSSRGQSHRTSQKRPQKASTAKRQRHNRPASWLSVLDAPGFVQLPIGNQPRFLKVASRRAQKETRKAAQSPRGKFLRLATERDTRDINQSLQDWQDGHIRPHHTDQANTSGIGPAANRILLPREMTNTVDHIDLEDLHDLDNDLLSIANTSLALSTLRNSTEATVQRILFRQQGLFVGSRRETRPTTSTSPIPPSLLRLRTGINFRKPIRNRAGLGSLQKTTTHPRTAQIEHLVPTRPSLSLSHPSTSVDATYNQDFDLTVGALRNTTSVTQIDEHSATVNPRPALQDPRAPRVRGTRKSTAPKRTQLVILTDAHRHQSAASSSIARVSDKVSEEAMLVIEIMNALSQENSASASEDGWSLLSPLLQKWLEVYANKESIRTPSEKRTAKEIFRRVRELVVENRWPTAWDDLIRKAAWLFSGFGMIDPFDSRRDPQLGLPMFLMFLDGVKPVIEFALPEKGETSFHMFLSTLAIALTKKSADVTDVTRSCPVDKKKKTELRSFVNRLYPNNGRLLSEQEEVQKVHLASLWNRCNLYLTLYCYTFEDCRPRLSHFQNLVDFSQSHIKACEVILAIWGVLSCFHAKKPEPSQYKSLTDVSSWMQTMILRMVAKWVDARKEIEKQLPGRAIEGHAMYIMQTNQSSVQAFLEKALETWTTALENCDRHSTTGLLFEGEHLQEVLDSMIDTFVDNDVVVMHMVRVVDAYLHKYSTAHQEQSVFISMTSAPPNILGHRLLLVLSRAIDKLLSQRFRAEPPEEEPGLTRVINRRLTYDWCLVAASLITGNEKSWDDFLEPAGKFSWERFGGAKRSSQYKTLFISHIIKDGDVYRNNKFWYLSYWLRALLRPTRELLFEHELSTAVLSVDQYEPMLMKMPLLLLNGPRGYELTLAELKHNRAALLRTVIEGIAIASTTHDSQTVDLYALQPPEMVDLLKTMSNTMRLTRSSLEHGSKERDDYEIMVCEVVESMDRYTSSIAPLESWVKDADAIAFARYALRKRFGGSLPAANDTIVSKQDVMWFQVTCQKAALQGTQDQIYEVLHNVYVDATDVPETEWFQPKMLAMMEQVFPAYVELALTDKGALMAEPLLRILDSICANSFLRNINMEVDDQSQLLNALYAIIVSARRAMQYADRIDRAVDIVMTFESRELGDILRLAPEPYATRALTFAYIVRIARVALFQYQEVVRCASLPRAELEKIEPHALYIQKYVRALYLCLENDQEDHWCELRATDRHCLSDPRTNKIKQFAAEQLERGLEQSWNDDGHGNYWVQQGRDAVKVKRAQTGGLLDPAMRQVVRDELEAFMRDMLLA